jgi:ankyrin repeat protein
MLGYMSKPLDSVKASLEEEKFQRDIPPEYLCSLTQKIMQDPVVAADGFSYERAAITTWLSTDVRSPLTQTPLHHRALFSNQALKMGIEAFLEKNPALREMVCTRKDIESSLQRQAAALPHPSQEALLFQAAAVEPQLSAAVLFNARSMRAAALRNSYEETQKHYQTLAQEANLKMQETIHPLQERRDRLAHEEEILSLQLQYLQKCEQQGPLSVEKRLELQNAYVDNVEELLKHFVSDYKNLVAARDFVYKEGVFVSIKTREEKAEVVARFEAKLREEELPLYRQWQLPTTSLDAKAAYLQKEAERKAVTEEYEKILELQTNTVQECLDEQSEMHSPLQALGAELNEVLQEPPSNPVYRFCQVGDVNALMEHLAQAADPKTYLAKEAPEALHIACEANQLSVVQYLIETLALPQTPDLEGYYPLHRAVKHVHPDPSTHANTVMLLEYLYEHGADAVDVLGPYHRTPLHTATLYGCVPGVMWLLAHQAEINRREKGRFQANTPLHNAAFAGHAFIVEVLLSRGADARLYNKSHHTPLMEGILQGQVEVAECFFKNGIWLSDSEQAHLNKNPLTVKARECLAIPLGANALSQYLPAEVQALPAAAAPLPKAWNSFDLAVGIHRQDLVSYALTQRADPKFRALLGPELQYALLIATARWKKEPFEEERKQSQESQIVDDRSQHILRVFQISTVDLAVKQKRVQSLCREEAYPFIEDYCHAKEMGEPLLSSAEQKFKAYCESEALYSAYIQDYYGASHPFVFEEYFAERNLSSMVDIVAKMLSSKICIHREQAGYPMLYATLAYGAKDIHLVYENHSFKNLPDFQQGLQKNSTPPIIFSPLYEHTHEKVPQAPAALNAKPKAPAVKQIR